MMHVMTKVGHQNINDLNTGATLTNYDFCNIKLPVHRLNLTMLTDRHVRME